MPDYIEKEARIFRAGVYPGKLAGKDFVCTVDDLKRIAANTTNAPIIHAHDEIKERLDYGTVDGASLNVRGDELWGVLKFHPEAIPFLEKNGLKSLSAGIFADNSGLKEISMTRRPHVKDAMIFSEDTDEVVFFSMEEDDADDVVVFGEGKGYFITVHGHAVYLEGKAVDKAHIAKAAAKHGLSNEAHEALKTAHDAGKVQTDEHLYKTIAHAKRQQDAGKSEGEAFTEALNKHATGEPKSSTPEAVTVNATGKNPVKLQLKEGFGAASLHQVHHLWQQSGHADTIEKATRALETGKKPKIDIAAIRENHKAFTHALNFVGGHLDIKRGIENQSSSLDYLEHLAKRKGVTFSDDTDTPSTDTTTFNQSEQTADERKPRRMTFWNKLFGSDHVTDEEKAEFTEAIKPLLPNADPQIAEFTAEINRLKQEKADGEARNFADKMINAGRALPFERETIAALFSTLAADDASGTVTFSDGTEKSRVELLTALFDARSQMNKLENIPETELVALFNQAQTKQADNAAITPERRAELLSKTDVGRAILADERKGSK